MKPLKLMMKAFGPYGGVEEIDFTKLQDKGIFLITGKTGSGKTTIFDGISYALYGETSMSDRSAESLRSQFAKDDQLTEISLTFRLKEREYSVHRIPKQMRAKKRGEGLVETKSEATLEIFDKEDKKVVTGVKNVNEKIQDIMGINGEQFKQIMMIPQGEFRKLLVSDSEDREKVLRKIFDTNIYNIIQSRLDTRAKAIYGEIKNQYAIRKKSISGYKVDEFTSVELEELLKAEDIEIQRVIELMRENSSQDKSRLEKHEHNYKEINEQINKAVVEKKEAEHKNNIIDNIIKIEQERVSILSDEEQQKSREKLLKDTLQAEKILPYEKNLNEKKNELEQIKKDISLSTQGHEKLKGELNIGRKKIQSLNSKEKIGKMDANREQIILLKKHMEKVESLEKLKQQRAETDIRFQKVTTELKLKENSREKISKDIQDNQKQLELYSEELIDLNKIDGEYRVNNERFKSIVDSVAELESFYGSLTSLYKETKKKKSQEEQMSKEFSAMETWRKEKFDEFIKSQASYIAENLTHGDACPVCGSKEHPNPAVGSDKAGKGDELEQLDEQIGNFREKLNKLKSDNAVLIERYKGDVRNFESLKEKIAKNIGTEDFEKIKFIEFKEIVDKELKEKAKDLKIMKEKIEKRIKIEELHKKIKKQIEIWREQFEEIKALCESLFGEEKMLNEKLSSFKAVQEEIESSIPLEITSLAELQRTINRIQTQVNDWEEAIKSVEEVIKSAENSISAVQGRLKVLHDNQEKIQESIVKQRKELRELIDKNFDSENHYENSMKHIPEIENLKEMIDRYNKRLESTQTKLKELSSMVKDREQISIEVIKEKIASLDLKRHQINEHIVLSKGKLSNNEERISEILEITDMIKEQEKEYSIVGRMAKISKGDNKYRMTFERYVLAAFLEDILNAANSRFQRMTSGRYLLNRTEELERKNKQSGLELEVFDNYTGMGRHVKTLSGGESFKASLSMALGLSDVVQSYAGGVRLDTMFIDEGFGTLDPESLDGAIGCLIDLQKSGRLVGIISHVPELKERIEAQLVVDSSNMGSSTKFSIF